MPQPGLRLPAGQRGFTRRKLFVFVASSVALTAGSSLLTACGQPAATSPGTRSSSAATGAPKKGGTFRIAYAGSADFLDPAKQLAVEDYNVTNAVYNNLVRLDAKMQLHPELATSWTPSDDLKAWTFRLREGVKYHHGKPFVAEDVVFSFKRILDPKTASPFRTILNFIDDVEKTDDHTVVFHLNQPYADLPTVLASYHGRIVPSDRSDDQIANEPSGTGPFKFKERVPGDHVTMVRNDEYWEPGLPYLDEIRQVTMPEQASRTAALSGGQIDMIWQVEPEGMAPLQGDPSVDVVQVPSGGYVPIVMRCDMAPFDDVRVRQAMKFLVDREQMRQAVMLGLGDPANDQPIPPIQPLFTDQGVRKRDVEKAKQLLKEAGHPNGIDIKLYCSPGRPGMVEQAVAFKEMAAPAGVRIDVQKIPIDTFWSDYWMKKPFTFSNWLMTSTIDETLSTTYQSTAEWNESAFKSPKLDALIVQARGERDDAKRKQIYAEAAKIITEEGGSIIAYFKPVISAMGKSVKGLDVHPVAWVNPRTIWLDS